MTERSQFDIDLAFGQARESAFYEAVTNARVECKSDQKARITGNLAIEIAQGSQRKPSGIAVSNAAWWAIEYDDDFWLTMRRSRLLDITRAVYKDNGSIIGGDNKNELVLVPILTVINWGQMVGMRNAA